MIFHIKSTSPQIRENDLERLHRYIGNQKEHHAKHSFAEEYRAFLELYHVEYDEKFVFRD